MTTDKTCAGLMAPCGARAGLPNIHFAPLRRSEPPRLTRFIQRLGEIRMRFLERKLTVFGEAASPPVEG
jgi:hypothetical protein